MLQANGVGGRVALLDKAPGARLVRRLVRLTSSILCFINNRQRQEVSLQQLPERYDEPSAGLSEHCRSRFNSALKYHVERLVAC